MPIMKHMRVHYYDHKLQRTKVEPDNDHGPRRHAQRRIVNDPKRLKCFIPSKQQLATEEDLLIIRTDWREFVQFALQDEQCCGVVAAELLVVGAVGQVGDLDSQAHGSGS